LALPAGVANVHAPKILFLVKEQCVVTLLVSEWFGAGFASVRPRLNVPIVHEALSLLRRGAELQGE
jgi:hypothetical protein